MRTLESFSFRKTFLEILEIIGSVSTFTLNSFSYLSQRRINFREFLERAYDTAYTSIITVLITNMSIGMVSSLQLAKHFVAFGATSEIGGTCATALFKELAPVITAVVLIGRVGSAWAAEIGTMKITEQISALKVMEIDLNSFLIAPRVWAAVLAMPILNMFAIFAGLLGGFFVAESIAHMGIETFVLSIKRYIDMYDCFVSGFKALCFGAMIASVSCFYGLNTEGGAIGVGRYTTKSVVSCLIFLFALNYLLSFIFYSLLK